MPQYRPTQQRDHHRNELQTNPDQFQTKLSHLLYGLRGPGGVQNFLISKSVFCVFLIEYSQGYHQKLTESKNIVPSQSYGIFKLGATVQLHYARNL